MSLTVQPPWVDGEKIPDDRIRTIFRQPPGAPQFFQRNCLVIGSRGVGKTTLIRYHKEIHEGVALHISLATELGSLTKQTALGPLAQDWPASLEPQVGGKATTMLALTLAERLIRKGVATPVGQREREHRWVRAHF